ncbi:GNAT family N-acetyltransferase [Roseiarcus sp.]|uniref:GNAT family N-acetyltransferase n=1 Tax=Roseiarcus sp. TaxID=1969460 RepID=UPI003F9CE1DA
MSASVQTLRGFDERDLPALCDLWVAAWRETGFPIDFEARRPWLVERLHAHRATGGVVVIGLDGDGRPAGFVTIDPMSGYLDQICVAPAEMGSGLAKALLDEAKRRSPGVVELDVNEANARGRRFYEREGFVVVTRGSSVQSGLPTWRMRWTARG